MQKEIFYIYKTPSFAKNESEGGVTHRKKTWTIPVLALALFLASCGNGRVADTDGIIGNEPAEKAEDYADDIKDDIKDAADDAKDKAKDAADDAKDKAKDAMDKAKGASVVPVAAGVRLNTEQAKQAALSDAGVNEKQATFYESYLHNQGGREYYDVVFSYGSSEYAYEIDAYTGAVLDRREASAR